MACRLRIRWNAIGATAATLPVVHGARDTLISDDYHRGNNGGGGIAAQPRATGDPRMSDKFDKFTERARKVLTLAQEEAQRFNHNYIGTEHLLLGLVREGDGVAARVLSNMGVQLPKVARPSSSSSAAARPWSWARSA